MNKFSLAFLSLLFVNCVHGQPNNKIYQITNSVDKTLINMNEGSYDFEQVFVNPSQNDSISRTVGRCWYQKSPSDPYFGAKFHSKSVTDIGRLEYYYDGQFGYEFQHDKKLITIFDPTKFENNPNNPAKARRSVSPLVEEFLDPNFPINLLDSIFDYNVQELNDKYLLSFISRPDEKFRTIKLQIDKSNFRIISLDQTYELFGLVYTMNRKMNHSNITKSQLLDSLIFNNSYPEYSIKEFEGYEKSVHESLVKLEGVTAPNFEGVTFQNEFFSLKDYEGSYVLLDFWEPWCGACIMAFPKIIELNNKYKEKGLKVIGLISVNKNSAEKIANKKMINYSTVVVNKSVHKEYGIRAFPTYLLISPERKVLKLKEGHLEDIINELEKIY